MKITLRELVVFTDGLRGLRQIAAFRGVAFSNGRNGGLAAPSPIPQCSLVGSGTGEEDCLLLRGPPY